MGLASLRQHQVTLRRSEECLTTSSQSPESSEGPDSDSDLRQQPPPGVSSRTESANQLAYTDEPIWTRQQQPTGILIKNE
jgi:hypothetical protein